MYRKIEKVFEKAQNVLLVLTGIALALMMCVIMLQTLTR